jgi:hypothetical protein
VSKTSDGLDVATVALTYLIGGLNFCYPTADAKVVQRKGRILVVRVRVVDGEPVTVCDPNGNAHSCTEQELADQEQNPDSQNWIRGCNTHPNTSFKVFDVVARKWTLIVTQYDDIDSFVTESERIRVNLGDTGIDIVGPDCKLHLDVSAANQ